MPEIFVIATFYPDVALQQTLTTMGYPPDSYLVTRQKTDAFIITLLNIGLNFQVRHCKEGEKNGSILVCRGHETFKQR